MEWRLTLLNGTRSNQCGFCYVNVCVRLCVVGGGRGRGYMCVCACICTCVFMCLCTCVHSNAACRLGEACSHVAALLFYLEDCV